MLFKNLKKCWWSLLEYKQQQDNEIACIKNTPNTYRFAVPFDFPLEKQTENPSLAVICHLYYPEMLEEFKRYLLNIPFSFDLFITTNTEEKKKIISDSLSNWKKGAVEIRLVPNRGRDIAPKLISCRDVYDRYEFFLHLHSKKSPYGGKSGWRSFLLKILFHSNYIGVAGWRFYLLETLIGSEHIVQSVFSAFANDAKLGIIAPEHIDFMKFYLNWGGNFNQAQKYAQKMGITLSETGNIDFPSGSMFWGRSAALKPLLAMSLKMEDFPTEENQVDATLAHAIERLYFFICEQAGYRWIKIARPSLLQNTEKIIAINSKELLINEIKDKQFVLLKKPNKK